MLRKFEGLLFYPILIFLTVGVLMGWTEIGPRWFVLAGTAAVIALWALPLSLKHDHPVVRILFWVSFAMGFGMTLFSVLFAAA